ncbi:TonB-dependent receptor [Phenylobacterium sp.]|uniref:TonB-dependent receptor n=1 Tax=Phenylobacterium sp. TaxID=1871053 RepID=UPI0035B31DB3
MSVSAAALTGFAAPAFAQSQGSGATVIEELVVTAQKKEEAIQDVPIAVSAFSEDALNKSKIDGGPNLVLAIPNVNFSKGNFTGYNFQIRGIGSKLVAASGDAGTGIHLNNAPLTSNNLFETEFYDVERVEVLRGPQGTLYGRNATGGVVNMITNKPVSHFEANIRGEVGNYDTRKVRGMINIPMGDALALRVAGSYLKRGGFGTNTFTGNDADDRDLYGIRATLGFHPTDNLNVTFMYDRFSEEDNRSRIGKQYCTKDTGPTSVGGQAFSGVGAIANIQQGFFTPGCATTSLYSPGALGTVDSRGTLGGLFGALTGLQTGDAYAGLMQDSNVRNISSTFDPIYQSHTDIYELTVDWDVTDSLKFTSLSSWTKYDLYTRQDYNRYTPSVFFNTTPNPVNAFAALGSAYTTIYQSLFPNGVVSDAQNGAYNRFTTSDISSAKTEQYSQEFRLQSAFDGPWNFNVGAIYLDYKAGDGDYYVMFNTGTAYYQLNNYLNTGNANCQTVAPCVAIDTNSDPNRVGHNYYDSHSPYHLKSQALFGELYWQMTDNFKWTLGLRYTDDDKRVDSYPGPLGVAGVGPLPVVKQHVEFKETTGRFGFDWKPEVPFTNSTLVYAFYSRGYKAGGLNSPCTAAAGVICGNPTFQPEFVNSIEIGTKNTLLDGSMILNATVFHYDYKGYQVSKIVNRASTNENIDAKIKGVELESVWSPLRPLRFNASIGYLDTEISNGTSIDTFDRTQGDSSLILVKSSAASNCVTTVAAAQAALAYSNATNNPFALLGLCTASSTAGAGSTVGSKGAIAVGTNAFGGLVSDGAPVNLKGKELPNAPHWTVSLGAQYTYDFGNGWDAVARVDYYHQSETFARIYNSAADKLNSWQNVNLTFTVANKDNGWSVDAYVKNATDEEVITDFYLTDDSSGLYRNAFFTEPRTYGIAVSKSW